jgi:hypothetical protein
MWDVHAERAWVIKYKMGQWGEIFIVDSLSEWVADQ